MTASISPNTSPTTAMTSPSTRAARAYYGSVGAPMDRPSEFAGAGSIVLVDWTGAARTVADGLSFPNGMVLTPDGSTLIVAESVGRCVTTFRVAADGSLSDRSVFAMLDTIPDGICLDAEGAVWVACPTSTEVQRVAHGARSSSASIPVARCSMSNSAATTAARSMSPPRRTSSHTRAGAGPHTGKIEGTRVAVPGV